MISTKLIEKIIPSYDSEVQQFIVDGDFYGGGSKMVIGIENQEKKIYRVIETTGMGDFMAVISFLIDLGLEDILAEKTNPVNGYDAIFRTEQISAVSH